MRKLLRSTAMALALLGAAFAGNLVASSPAQAYSGCWGSGGAHTDYWGNTYGTRWCNAYSSGYMRAHGSNVGYLYAGNSWFVCQHQWVGYENPAVGSARNNWWLYTQGDDAYQYNGWGWFPATRISGGVNYGPIPGLRDCGEIPFFPFPSP
jgi:hypothetical protein